MAEPEIFLDGRIVLHCGDCLAVLPTLAENSVDSCVTDPPYHLTSIVKRFGADNAAPCKTGKTGAYARASAGFMGKQWDGGDIAFRPETWAHVLRVLKPGGHLIAFGGTRTYHRMACAIEDAGFEIRDQIQWLYGSGFPKSHDVSKGIDRANGDERPVHGSYQGASNIGKKSDGKFGYGHDGQTNAGGDFTVPITSAASAASAAWEGWGTALKPACEPIVLARKPLSESTVAANVLKWGTGALNIDSCRVGSDTRSRSTGQQISENTSMAGGNYAREIIGTVEGRWPANIIHDGSEEATEGFPKSASSASSDEPNYKNQVFGRGMGGTVSPDNQYSDFGSAARFFYTAKADSDDRLGSKHPTVKPLDLMQYMVRLITPPKGLVLDLFSGTGTTGEAAWREGFSAVLIEREAEYQADIRRRMVLCMSGPAERARESIKARMKDKPEDHGPLFGGLDAGQGRAGQGRADRYTGTSQIKTNDWPDRAQVVSEG